MSDDANPKPAPAPAPAPAPVPRAKARLPRGFHDRGAEAMRAEREMLDVIRGVFERYGFEGVETPLFEYTDALGKFLPDQDRPNEGVFSLQDEDAQWLSLRYDLTAPLARHYAENRQRLPKPYRSWRAGPVFRNEKPGPGRFRQFTQCDADIVGSSSVAADAEICMMACDVMEALGFEDGDYVVKINDRRILDGVMEGIGLSGPKNASRRLGVLRSIDKLDKLGQAGVRQLLGEGRRDESGDFTAGVGLTAWQIDALTSIVFAPFLDQEALFSADIRKVPFENIEHIIRSDLIIEAIDALGAIQSSAEASGYSRKKVSKEQSIVRGLEYYTGPVYEIQLTADLRDPETGGAISGTVGGGGRYDGLVGRFTDEPVPACGFSVGVSRLLAAVTALKAKRAQEAAGGATPARRDGPVVVTVMERDRIAEAQALAASLRRAFAAETARTGEKLPGVELYLGEAGFKAQLKHADRRRAPVAVIQGSNERERGEVQLKDLALGERLAANAAGADRAAHLEAQAQAQRTVPVAEMAAAVIGMLRAG